MSGAAVPAPRVGGAAAGFDPAPIALAVVLAVGAWPLVGSTSTWLTLTAAGLAMGMIIFMMASGLTLVFGLMDVLNFGHGVFIALGAYLATTVFAGMSPWANAPDVGRNLACVGATLAVAAALAGVVGWAFERVLIRPVYGRHLAQILITMGGMIIGEELIKVFWGAAPIPIEMPTALRGVLTVSLGAESASVEKFRVLATAVGGCMFLALLYGLNRTKLGLLVRAGVQDKEMVECLGYTVSRLFVGVFVAGSALAGVGGAMWGIYQHSVVPQIGSQINALIFIVIIIGGLGSTTGCFIGAVLVGLLANYAGFLAPKLALFSNIGLLAAVLLWRPQGLYPVGTR
jgi:branched-chain amino acid transport system permease protein